MEFTKWMLLGCTLLFALRVIGQVIVARRAPSWLPAMEHWYSGLMPYRYLLPAQLILLTLMILIAYDIHRMDGFFAASGWEVLSAPLKLVAVFYFASMIARYVLTMVFKPERRWFRRTIPIWFHMVLATALWSFGTYHSL